MPYVKSRKRFVVVELFDPEEEVYIHGPFTSQMIAEGKMKSINNAKLIRPWESSLEVMQIEVDDDEDLPERRARKSAARLLGLS